MPCKHPSRRLAAAGVLALQLVLLVVLPRADAVLEADSHHVQAHIEAPGEGTCSPSHDHHACQICRGIGMHALVTPGDTSRVTGDECTRQTPPVAWLADSQHTTRANRTRAPPLT